WNIYCLQNAGRDTMSQIPKSAFTKNVLLLFTNGLREMQRELRQSVEKAQQEIRAFVGSGLLDAVDACCGNCDKEAMFSRNSENRIRLREVERALERMQNGHFGVCVTCEVAIGLKRLQVLPWASNCIECQERCEQGRPVECASLQPSFAG